MLKIIYKICHYSHYVNSKMILWLTRPEFLLYPKERLKIFFFVEFDIFNVYDLNRGNGGSLLVGPVMGLASNNNIDEIPSSAITLAETMKTAFFTAPTTTEEAFCSTG